MRKPKKEIQLTSYDDLLGISDMASDKNDSDQMIEVALEDLHAFRNHPYQVLDDDKMEETVESIKTYGVLNPGLVRPRPEGGYELISGHRRKRACELAGKTTMPVLVRNYTDDEAVVVMVDSNIQREHLKYSEKAWAYKMKMDALRHQGTKTGESESADEVGKKAGDSGRTVQRYIRLTSLIPFLLQAVDDGKISFVNGVALSYLSREEQSWVQHCIQEKKQTVTSVMIRELRRYSAEGNLTELAVQLILGSTKPKAGKFTLPEQKIRKYFPPEYASEQIEEVILELLENWKNNRKTERV